MAAIGRLRTSTAHGQGTVSELLPGNICLNQPKSLYSRAVCATVIRGLAGFATHRARELQAHIPSVRMSPVLWHRLVTKVLPNRPEFRSSALFIAEQIAFCGTSLPQFITTHIGVEACNGA